MPFYIGKTSTLLSKRVYRHKKNFGDDVQIEEIDCIPSSEWKFWECFYINLFKSWGFKLVNKNNGGGGLEHHSNDSKKKISESWNQKNDKEKELINLKRGLGNIGKKKPNAGRKKFTEEQLINHRKNSRFSQPDWSEKCKKIIYMVEPYTGEIVKEFPSVKEAAEFLGVTPSSISSALIGYSKTSCNFKWEYKK